MTKYTLLDKAKIHLVIEAYKIYDNQQEVCKHIGISPRALRNWTLKYKEINKYRRPPEKKLPGEKPYWIEHVLN